MSIERFISIADAVALLRRERGVSRTRMHLSRLARMGTLKAQLVGKSYVTTEADVLYWYDNSNHTPGNYPRKTPTK